MSALPRSGRAQSSLWLDAALSSARPPAGAPQLETTNYGILGLRGETALPSIKLTGSLSGGRALESNGGKWLWTQVEAEHDVAKAGLFLLDYSEGFRYRSGGVQLQKDVKLGADGAFTLRPLVTLARWRSDTAAVTYAVAGGSLEWNRTHREVLFRLHADAFMTGNNSYGDGGYASLGADAYYVFRGTTVGAGITQGFDPHGDETGFMVWATRPVNDNLRVDVQIAHTVADPVFGSPGSLGFTLSGSWRFLRRERASSPTLATVGAPVSRGRVVKFTLQAPAHAKTVAVSGTFSDWQPIAMKREGDLWSGSVTIPAGTHQYGFLLNGQEWFVPENAADIVDDGFGRKNVTLVVRPK